MPAQERRQPTPELARLLAWVDAVGRHTPGLNDLPARDVGRWWRDELDTLVKDLRRISMFQQRAREGRLGAAATLQIYNQRFSLAAIA